VIRLGRIRGVPVLLHWSVPAACFFFLGVGWRAIVVMAAAIAPPHGRDGAFVAVIGFASPMIAVLNLLPIKPLDGSRAWQLLRVRRRPRAPEESALEAFERARRDAISRGRT